MYSFPTYTRQQLNDDLKILVFPNPVSRMVKVQFEASASRQVIVELRDAYGRVLRLQNVFIGKQQSTDFGMYGYISGIYYIVIKDTKGNILSTNKLVKID
jgi:hypothetical protein